MAPAEYNPPDSQPDRKPPDDKLCRVRKHIFIDLYECLVPEANSCKHAVIFGNGAYCLHPERQVIAARAKTD